MLLLLFLGARRAVAQSQGQLSAWDGLVLSPVGALVPIARAPGDLAAGHDELSLRYGRWRYDSEDAVHDNIGLAWTRGLGFARAQVTVTAAYEMVECPTCSSWAAGGIDVQSTLWEHGVASAEQRQLRTGIALCLSLGGAKVSGAEASTAGSTAISLPIDVGFPLGRTSWLSATIVPGYGFGHVTGPDFAAGGLLPMIGGAISWNATSRMSVNIGAQQVILSGAPSQVGAALSWKLR